MAQVEATELEITFVDAAPPPLPAGDFRLGIEQSVAWTGGNTAPFRSEYDLTVNGPRFTIDPIEVHSTFPPPGNRGHFQKYLPHLVLARRSLPWERTVDNSIPQDKPFVPWLWLLNLDQAEMEANQIEAKTIKLDELLNPPDRILGPDIARETGDDPEQQLLVIDVPTALLNTLVPSKEDLTYSASARIVSVMDKEITPATEDEWFSVVMANRFSKNGETNSLFLVSLEGYGTADNDIFFPNQVDPAKYDAVRLVMLFSWNFTNVNDDQTFDQLMKGLCVERLALPNTTANSVVNNAFDMGYTALNHITREGEPSVSWYRGPLLPSFMPRDPPPAYPDGTYPNGDAALRFDPANGMFDVSYATAWQIGRLLGLQNGEFAAAIARLRDGNLSAMHTLAARSFLFQRLNSLLTLPRDFRGLLGRQVFDNAMHELWGTLLGPALAGSGDQPALLGPPADPSRLRRHSDAMPALLSDDQIAELIGGNGEALESLMGMIRNQGEDE